MKISTSIAFLIAALVPLASPTQAQDDDESDPAGAACTVASIGVAAATYEVINMGGGDGGTFGERIFFAMLAGGAGYISNEVCEDVVARVSESFEETMENNGYTIDWSYDDPYGVVPGVNYLAPDPACLSHFTWQCRPRLDMSMSSDPGAALLIEIAWDIVTRGTDPLMVGSSAIISSSAYSGTLEAAFLTADDVSGESYFSDESPNDGE